MTLPGKEPPTAYLRRGFASISVACILVRLDVGDESLPRATVPPLLLLHPLIDEDTHRKTPLPLLAGAAAAFDEVQLAHDD